MTTFWKRDNSDTNIHGLFLSLYVFLLSLSHKFTNKSMRGKSYILHIWPSLDERMVLFVYWQHENVKVRKLWTLDILFDYSALKR